MSNVMKLWFTEFSKKINTLCILRSASCGGHSIGEVIADELAAGLIGNNY